MNKMNKKRLLKTLVLLIVYLLPTRSSALGKSVEKPNIILILADDLGYADVGCYGQKLIETSQIDALASEGIVFRQAYSSASECSPSRCSLLTGMHTGHIYIRGNDEMDDRGDVWNYKKTAENINLEGQLPIPAETVTIGKVLQKCGYITGCFGKWGLGAPNTEGVPNKQGFDYFYGYNCHRQAHSYFPNHLWRNDSIVHLNNQIIMTNSKLPDGADIYDERNYEKYYQKEYSPDLILNECLKFIENNAGNRFFTFFSTTLPHGAFQAPPDLVKKYVSKLGDEEPVTKSFYYPCRYPHATYAAMVTYLDSQIGAIISKLKELGIYENTLIIITSDNGPSSEISAYFQSAGPFLSTKDRVKFSLYEGGIRVPLIAVWKGHIKKHRESQLPIVLYDLFPTFCELAGIPVPEGSDGVSFITELSCKTKKVEPRFLYWESQAFGGQQAARYGHWKALRQNINTQSNLTISLYDLDHDIQELNDVSSSNPDVVKKMEEFMKNAHQKPQVGSFRLIPFDN